jgi:hypothetical protein
MAIGGIQFISEFYDVISMAALHTYISALPLAPPKSVIYKTYMVESVTERPWMVSKTGSDEEWACIQTLRGFTGIVESVAYSSDSSKVINVFQRIVQSEFWMHGDGFLLDIPFRDLSVKSGMLRYRQMG